MGIVVNYGPISGALSLAQKAGVGQGFASQAQRDLEALQIQNQLQQTANTEAQHEIQNGMAYNQMANQQQVQQQQLSQQQAYQNAQMQLAQQNSQTRAEQADALATDRKAAAAAAQQRQDMLGQLSPEEQKLAMFPGLGQAAGRGDANARFLAGQVDKQVANNEAQAAKLEAAAKKLDPVINGQDAIDALMSQAADLRKQTDEVDPATGMSLRQQQAALRNTLGSGQRPTAQVPQGQPGQAVPPSPNGALVAAALKALGSRATNEQIKAWIALHQNQANLAPAQPGPVASPATSPPQIDLSDMYNAAATM